MRRTSILSVLLVAACAGRETPSMHGDSSTTKRDTTAAADYSSPVVLFVSPDSAQVDAMKARLGDDFFTIADDAMWYQAQAYELVDSLHIPHAEVRPGAARFLVEGRPSLVSWRDTTLSWYAVVYDGRTRPRIVAHVDIRSALLPAQTP